MQQADKAATEQAPPVSTPPTAAIVNGADRQQRSAQHMQLPHHKRDIISQFMRYTEEISGLAIFIFVPCAPWHEVFDGEHQ